MDIVTSERRSQIMRAIRSKGMKPEIDVRRMVHRLGFRYRLHRSGLPGRPDLVFASRRKVIFVHGCFWHQHESRRCPDSHRPKSRREYWEGKLERNRARDKRNILDLKRMGWQVLVIWECQLKNPDRVRARVLRFLSGGDPGTRVSKRYRRLSRGSAG